MILQVISYEAYYRDCSSHVLDKNFRIDGVKINVLKLYIKVIKQKSKSSSSDETNIYLISNDIKDVGSDCLIFIVLSLWLSLSLRRLIHLVSNIIFIIFLLFYF